MTLPDRGPAPVSPRIRVLVVDDDTRVRAGLRALIATDPGLELVGEASGAAAALTFAAADAGLFVALVDVVVHPDGSGLALVQMLSQTPGCRVVAMSVRGGFRAAARAAGAVQFVEKGDDAAHVLSAIRAAGAQLG